MGWKAGVTRSGSAKRALTARRCCSGESVVTWRASNRRVWLRPPPLAVYRAASAKASSSRALTVSSGKTATPAEQPRTAHQLDASTAVRARSATSMASMAPVPGSISANSSPPTRPTRRLP